MSLDDTALAIGLVFALALSVGNMRAWVWLLAGAASYTVSTIYWRLGGGDAPFVAAMCDAMICLAVYFKGKLRWETVTGWLFIGMVAINGLYYLNTLGVAPSFGKLSRNDYAIILLGINWLALLWIGGTGAAQFIGAGHVSYGGASRGFGRLMRSLYRPRHHPPFTAKAHSRQGH